MRKFFGIMATLLVVGFSLATAYADGKKENCDERCQFQKHGPGTGLKPAIRNEVCFRFVQGGKDFVTLTLYSAYEGVNSPNNRVLRQIKHAKPDGQYGQFCIGTKSWVSRAVFVDICNDINHSDRGIPSLERGMQTGVVDMCLLGKDCPRYIASE